jgi:di/tripeptidase
LYYFEEICRIPHGSRNTKQISDYLVAFAREHGLRAVQDELNNVVIYKDGTPGYEEHPTVILQGHMDMVAEKTKDSPIDFTKDPLELRTDGVDIWADGTTLGGDDGIAANSYTRTNDGANANPCIFLNRHFPEMEKVVPVMKVMVNRRYLDLRTY